MLSKAGSITRFICPVRLTAGLLWLLLCAMPGAAPPADAQAPIQTFYVAVTEVEAQTWAEALQPTVDNDVMHTVISITVTTDTSIIYFDHWEDTFEFDVTAPIQATTEAWGDGDASTGCAPNLNGAPLVCTDANDVLGAGDVVILENDVDVTGGTRDPNVILFDGGDKLEATQLLAVTRAVWTGDAPVGAQLGAAIEVFAVGNWGTSYEAPVGEDLNGGAIGETFEFVAFSIMAEEDGTMVDVDADASGTPEISQVLNQGESLLVEDVLVGATVSSSGEVQVDLLTANEDTGYEGRWFSLIPSSQWSDEYFSPVGSTTAGDLVHVYLYNPAAGAIDIQAWELIAGVPTCTDVVVGGDSVVEYALSVETPLSAAQFLSDGTDCAAAGATGGNFFAVATIDRNETIHDWGYTLIPTASLTPAAVVGWAPGATAPPAENASPVWVTAIDPPGGTTTLHIDFDGDPTTGLLVDLFGNRYDLDCTANALESVRIFDGGGAGTACRRDGDFDQTGMRIYTVDSTRIAAAWGQDPAFAASGQPQQLDMGTTVVPFSSLTAFKDGALLDDLNGNGQLDEGETILYTIRVINNGLIPISDIDLIDTLDPNVTYLPNSTEQDAVPVADDLILLPGDTVFPLDADTSRTDGYPVVGPFPDQLLPGQTIEVTFVVTVNTPFPSTSTEIINTVIVRSDEETFLDSELNPIPRMDVDKTATGLFCPGETISYQIVATNLSGFSLTNMRVFDPLPANTSYSTETTTAVGQTIPIQVRDEFGSVSFGNNDGKDDWTGNWIELDDNCGLGQCVPGPAAGQVQITGGQLRLDDQPDTGGEPGAEREVALSGAGTALFSFDFETSGGVDTSDAVTVDVSDNGGASYTTLEVISGISGATTSSRVFDISAWATGNTRVRFRITNLYGGSNEFFFVDNVDVTEGTIDTYADQFGSVAYNNSDGSLDWTTQSWIETNDDGDPAAGNIDIVGGELHFVGSGGAPLRQIERELDLSGAASATFTFDWRCAGDMEATQDFVLIEVSPDGGTGWNTLETKEGEVDMCLEPGDADSGSESYDITPYIASNTRIRFGFNISAGDENFYVDNLTVFVAPPTGLSKDNAPGGDPDLIDGDPADLVLAADGFALAPAGTLTVNYDVVLANPLDPSDSPIVNKATVTSTESPDSSAVISSPLVFATIGDLVWEDLDEDGVKDGPELGIPGVTVNLLAAGCGGAPLATDVTDSNGLYSFPDLSPIEYCVQVDETTLPPNLTEHTTMNNPHTVLAGNLAACATDDTADFGYNDPVTVPVSLSSFSASSGGSGTRFEWTTATEAGNIGFNLYALTQGGWTKVNKELVASKVVDSAEPQSYVLDAAVEGSSFFIEDVDVSGKSQLHGPFHRDGRYGGRGKPAERIDWSSIRLEREAQKAGTTRSNASPAPRASRAGGGPRRGPAGQRGLARKTLPELLVDREGVYRLTYEELAAAGLELADVPTDQLRLTQRGQDVPIFIGSGGVAFSAPGTQGARRQFGPGQYIEFVGDGLDTLYTDTNVYRLRIGRGRQERARVDFTPPSPVVAPAPFYLERAEIERDREYSFGSTNGDPWYDTLMLAFTSAKSFDFDVQVDALASGAGGAELLIDTWGMTSWPQQPDHRLEVSFNGARVAEAEFDGQETHVVEAKLPSGLLSEGLNQLELTLPADTGAPWDIIVLDSYTLVYPRHFVARDDRLTFSARGQAFRVEGLSSPAVVVYRRGPDGLTRLDGVAVGESGGAYTATFTGSQKEATYYVSTEAALRRPALRPQRGGLEQLTRGDADYLVISHPDFVDGLDPLLEQRRADGLSVKVVDVEDVYARYSHGIFDAQAIRDYIADAAGAMKPSFVLLVGGDSYDYKDHLGLGAISFLPSLYRATDDIVRFAPVDPLYVDLDGDLVPDLPLGRLPVRTSDELDSVVAKTLGYAEIEYPRTGVFAADAESGASFSEASDALIAQLPPGWSIDRAYIDSLGVAVARELLISDINFGTALTSFFGHSGPSVWSFSGLFDTTDAEELFNHGLPTVVTQWGCWNTYYVSPQYDSMAHKLLLSGDRGAAAVLGASTLTRTSSDRALGEHLTPLVTQPGITLGEALTKAKQGLAGTRPQLLDVLLGFTLLGDPALSLEVVEER